MAFKKGTRIVKCNSAQGDGHEDGSPGTVTEVMEIPIQVRGEVLEALLARPDNPRVAPVPKTGYMPEAFYMIEWDDAPGVKVGIADYRIKEA